jgi:prepilin-type N-terminal cleavage/methylation domain-containing protein
MTLRTRRGSKAGFTLIETMIALLVLVIGLLGLAAVLANGIAYMNASEYDYIAQQKAAQAIESIFTARDIGQATWGTICNVGSSVCSEGIFLNGPLPLCGPGPDGILGTADDYAGASCAGPPLAAPDAILLPNNTGVFGANPVRLTLSTYTRTIAISTVLDPLGNPISNLRQITVTINYSAGPFRNRTYTLNAYISNFS